MICVRRCARICVAAIAEVLEAAAIVLLAATIVMAIVTGTSTDGRTAKTRQMKVCDVHVIPVDAICK